MYTDEESGNNKKKKIRNEERKKMKKIQTKTKKNAGITLVALTITIIVLLILAGIIINLTIGQEGILSRAQEAGRNHIEGEERDAEILANHENYIAKYVEGSRDYKSEIEELKTKINELENKNIDYNYENPIFLFQTNGWEKYTEDTVILDNYKVQQDGLFSVCMGLGLNNTVSQVVVYINGKMINYLQAYSQTVSPIHLPVKKDDVIKVLVSKGSYVYASKYGDYVGSGIVIYPLIK